jgi:thiol-disulfide isomerase/thioredoxin
MQRIALSSSKIAARLPHAPQSSSNRRAVKVRARVETLFLEEGFVAPEFTLPWPEKGFENVSLMNDVVKADTKAVVFLILSNHCPFVVHLKDEIIKISDAYKSKGVEFVAISPNDPKIKEKDSAELMAQEGYPFPYLFDEAQEVAKMYKGMCTPDIYAFKVDGGELKLAYQGQVDSSRPVKKGGDPNVPNNGEDLRAALDYIVNGKAVPKPWKPSIGCSIKWSEGNEPEYWGSS